MSDQATTTTQTTDTTSATTQQAQSWRDSLPDDLKKEPSLATVPDVQTLAKNYLETKKAFGAEKMLKPQASWTEKEWGEFYAVAGRPEAPDKYTMPELKLEDGIKVDDNQMAEFRKVFHEAGMSDAQAKKVISAYFEKAVNPQIKAQRESEANAKAELEKSLRSEWGSKYDQNAQVAEMALSKFADADTLNHIRSTGLIKHPGLAKFLYSVGSKMVESSVAGKEGAHSGSVPPEMVARQELDLMKGNKAEMDRYYAGDRAMMAKWSELHKRAYPPAA